METERNGEAVGLFENGSDVDAHTCLHREEAGNCIQYMLQVSGHLERPQKRHCSR